MFEDKDQIVLTFMAGLGWDAHYKNIHGFGTTPQQALSNTIKILEETK